MPKVKVYLSNFGLLMILKQKKLTNEEAEEMLKDDSTRDREIHL